MKRNRILFHKICIPLIICIGLSRYGLDSIPMNLFQMLNKSKEKSEGSNGPQIGLLVTKRVSFSQLTTILRFPNYLEIIAIIYCRNLLIIN